MTSRILGAVGGLVVLLTNASAVSTVAMERYITNYSSEKAAMINSLSAVPGLYEPGFEIGHALFYGDNNFRKTADRMWGKLQ